MSPETTSTPISRGWVRLLIAFVVALDVAAFFQWADGAFQSEFGGHPDEATHYLTGLRARDAALHTWDRTHPGEVHHPVAALRRTPAFDVAQGAWMLIFGTSRIAALLFMATLAAATTTLIFGTVRREFGDWAAVVAALLWLCAPAVRESYETILPEQFGAFLFTGAALLWARVMDARGRSGALQNSADAQSVAPVPDASNQRQAPACRLIRALALLGGGGVLAHTLAVALEIAPGDPRAAFFFLKECVSVPGIAVVVFAIAGVVIRRRSEARMNTVWVAMIVLVAGVLFARWMKAGVPDVRVLIVAAPALAMLAVRGAVSLAGIVGSQTAIARERSRRAALWILLLLLLALPADLLSHREKEWQGFGPIALTLAEESRGPARVLVVSDPRGEGMLISEIAMRDLARQITIERGSETLADSAGSPPRGKPQERFIEDEQLFAHLTDGRIRYIVLDSAVPEESHAGYHDQVRRIIEGNVRSFWPISDSPIIRDGEPQGHPLRIFRVMKPDGVELQLQ